ncbi:MAG: Hpt domain-containing protein [bacterium]
MKTLDRNLLLENVDGDFELLRELVDLFHESCEEILGNLRQAVESSATDDVSRFAHQLKGALANLGAQAGAEAARQLESIGRTATVQDAPPALAELERQLDLLAPELKQLVDTAA